MTGKRLFKEIVDSMSPPIPHSTIKAGPCLLELVRDDRIINVFVKEAQSKYAKNILPGKFIEYIIDNLNTCDENLWKNVIDFNILLLRVYIICKMNEIISRDIAQ